MFLQPDYQKAVLESKKALKAPKSIDISNGKNVVIKQKPTPKPTPKKIEKVEVLLDQPNRIERDIEEVDDVIIKAKNPEKIENSSTAAMSTSTSNTNAPSTTTSGTSPESEENESEESESEESESEE